MAYNAVAPASMDVPLVHDTETLHITTVRMRSRALSDSNIVAVISPLTDDYSTCTRC